MKSIVLTTYTPYPSRKIQRICALNFTQHPRRKDLYAISRRKPYAVFKSKSWNILEYNNRTTFRFPPYQFYFPERKLTMEEMLDKFINESKREQKEMEIFINKFRTTNELLLKEQKKLLSELKIKVYELGRVMSDVPVSRHEIKGVTTRGGKMMPEATYSKEVNLDHNQ
ncbi:hypothetical protein Tco_0511340 [Tanacetum coccineum]